MKLTLYLACGHSRDGDKKDGKQIAILRSEGKVPYAMCFTCDKKVEVKAKQAQRNTPPPKKQRR